MVVLVLSAELFPWLVGGAAALAVLVKGAGIVVDRLVALARRYDVPDALVASTIVAIGTSLPELSSHVVASLGILSGSLEYGVASATVLGGNMGSSTVQQTLLVGLFVIGFGRTTLSRSFLDRTYFPMVAAFVVTLAVSWDRTVSRLDGLLLLGCFAVYGYVSVTKRDRSGTVGDGASTAVARDVVVTIVALLAVLGSAFAFLAVVERIVSEAGLNGSLIGVLTIGLAAALPELSTVVEALRRRQPDLALGTLIGSNVVNPLLGFGLGGALSTYAVPPSVVQWDLPFKLVVAVGLLAVARRGSNVLTRREGAWLIAAYFVFIAVRFLVYAG